MRARGLGTCALCLWIVIFGTAWAPAVATREAGAGAVHGGETLRSRCLGPLQLPRQPTKAWTAGPGVRATVWQWEAKDRGPLRVAAVEMKPGSGALRPVASIPAMTDPATAASRRESIAVLNGDYFDTMQRGDAVPQGALIVGGKPVFVPAGWSSVAVWNTKQRLRTSRVALDATLASGEAEWKIATLNDPLVTGSQLAVMTSGWQRTHVPDGDAAIVVKGDVVASVHRRTRDVRIPRNGFVVVAASARALPSVKPGDAVTLDLGVEVSDHQQIVHASGHGGVALKNGELQPICSAYERLLRPRSMLAWGDDGRIWLLTASSGLPDSSEGMRRGGMTKEELAYVARELGASTAVVLDGGGSTALFAKRGDGVTRLDMPAGSWVRPVPVVWQVTAR